MSATQALATRGEATELQDRWTDIFRRDQLVHLAIMASITAGTFLGYLKDRIPGILPYALADAFFFVAVVAWLGTLAIRHAPLRGPGWSIPLLLVVTVVPTVYLLHPATPFLIELAGLRAWIEFPVGCLIALSVIRTTGQVRAYIGLALILGVVTALYGIWQYRQGPQTYLTIGSLAELRHGATVFYYIPGTGQVRFRAFSTFTFPAPFALMMVFAILLAAGIAASSVRRRPARVLAALLIPLFFLGITVSGTRAAILILGAGLLVIARYRRLTPGQVLLGLLMLLALYLGSVVTAGAAINRFATVFAEEGLLWLYLKGPIVVALRAVTEHPVGLGLGRTGVGVPFAITRSVSSDFFVFSDGDVGRAGVEMGYVGVLLVILIAVGFLLMAWRAVRALRGTDTEDVALGVGALLTATGLGFLIGSPLAAAPHGMIWWFFLGALLKLGAMADERRPAAPATAP